jgi:1,4-dihydroxy-2-naphthoyl-CoA hydrolase
MSGFPVAPVPGTFDAIIGLVVDSASDEEVRAHVVVRDELKQPMGLVHGGVFASIAESIASAATHFGVMAEGKSAQGLSNQTSFLRPIFEGTIHAVARRRHRGRTTWIWEVEISDDQERLCALVRMTIAVR